MAALVRLISCRASSAADSRAACCARVGLPCPSCPCSRFHCCMMPLQVLSSHQHLALVLLHLAPEPVCHGIPLHHEFMVQARPVPLVVPARPPGLVLIHELPAQAGTVAHQLKTAGAASARQQQSLHLLRAQHCCPRQCCSCAVLCCRVHRNLRLVPSTVAGQQPCKQAQHLFMEAIGGALAAA